MRQSHFPMAVDKAGEPFELLAALACPCSPARELVSSHRQPQKERTPPVFNGRGPGWSSTYVRRWLTDCLRRGWPWSSWTTAAGQLAVDSLVVAPDEGGIEFSEP